MMRVGIFSDSHGDHRALDELLEKMGYIDAACFLGDIARDAWHLEDALAAMPNQPRLYAVRGNNDYNCHTLPLDMMIELGGVTMYLTHGHMAASYLSLAYRAKEKGAKVALFGHTHEAMCEMMDGVMLLNPGSAGNFCCGGRARASLLEIDGENLSVRQYMV